MRKTIIFGTFLFTLGCGKQQKTDGDGEKLTQAEAIQRLTDIAAWCSQDVNHVGAYSGNIFNKDELTGQYVLVQGNLRKNYAMSWTMSDDALTRNMPELSPNPVIGHATFGKTDGLNFVKIVHDDKTSEVLTECTLPH